MIPKVCESCETLTSCKSQCCKVYNEVCDSSQGRWKMLEQQPILDVDEYSNEDSLLGWDKLLAGDHTLFEKPLSERESYLVMLLLAGYNRQEAQEVLKVSKGSIDKMMHRIRGKLRKGQA